MFLAPEILQVDTPDSGGTLFPYSGGALYTLVGHSILWWGTPCSGGALFPYSGGALHTLVGHSILWWDTPYSGGALFHTLVGHSILWWGTLYSGGALSYTYTLTACEPLNWEEGGKLAGWVGGWGRQATSLPMGRIPRCQPHCCGALSSTKPSYSSRALSNRTLSGHPLPCRRASTSSSPCLPPCVVVAPIPLWHLFPVSSWHLFPVLWYLFPVLLCTFSARYTPHHLRTSQHLLLLLLLLLVALWYIPPPPPPPLPWPGQRLCVL